METTIITGKGPSNKDINNIMQWHILHCKKHRIKRHKLLIIAINDSPGPQNIICITDTYTRLQNEYTPGQMVSLLRSPARKVVTIDPAWLPFFETVQKPVELIKTLPLVSHCRGLLDPYGSLYGFGYTSAFVAVQYALNKFSPFEYNRNIFLAGVDISPGYQLHQFIEPIKNNFNKLRKHCDANNTRLLLWSKTSQLHGVLSSFENEQKEVETQV